MLESFWFDKYPEEKKWEDEDLPETLEELWMANTPLAQQGGAVVRLAALPPYLRLLNLGHATHCNWATATPATPPAASGCKKN